MRLAGLEKRHSIKRMFRLLLLFLVLVFMLALPFALSGCSSTEDFITEDGVTYRVARRKVVFITYDYDKEKIDVSDDDFNAMMARREMEHALLLKQQEEDHAAALKAKAEEQKLKEKLICTWISGICIALAALSVVAGYFTREWRWCGGLSLLFCGIAAGAAVFGDFLLWWHSVSGFVIWAAVAAVSLWLFRKFSLWEWIRGKFKKSTKEGTPTDE